MFNAPRPSQPYAAPSSNGFGASFVNENPLANSMYDDGLDPWSSTPSPAPPAFPKFPSPSTGFSSVIGDATVPAIYHQAFAAVDSDNSGETSVSALSRVLATSSLPASTIEKIVSLVSSRPRVSRLEFFVALALAALAQSSKDVSIERVAALARENALSVPNLDLSALASSTSTFNQYPSSEPHHDVPQRGYSTDDPWSAPKFPSATSPSATNGDGVVTNGVPSSISGTGLPKEWWKNQQSVHLNVLGQQGFLLNRYLVYEVFTDRGQPVPRRYSEFVFLWECLVKRYPFRLLPALPPKRVGPDENFLEQRRKGLARFLNFVINHPVIKEDGLLAVFLTEPNFESWRKHSSISYDEESTSKRVDHVEEMSIPSDLEDKLAVVRGKVGFLIEHWQKICMLAERVIRRREAEAADLARLTNTMNSLVEINEHCWRGDECELCGGVRQGLVHAATHVQKHSDLLEHRSRTMLYNTLEALKSQRDIYIAVRDLFIRHDRLSSDQVDRLKKRIESNSLKLEGVKQAQKEGWETEADKITVLIEKDQTQIATLLNRRVFIRACMWHELRVVLHNRENALLTQMLQTLAREELDFSESVVTNWTSLVEAVEDMPFE
ncbi:uncharacterized protein LAESUDRAFT_722098 [Laetiporus sulphureus 93-53]|uniref:Sorting nexin MVP1 n=1 Tax=Laetiporus sulphureus 93-53 TaxID=1314785 RepID=A0A165G7Q1_9APHY|nr:uncharacterized protein LAESUDRAFT_722098 [Laetiporus sulphureus 93-53]KZT09942.1 hypothetical protein LAESUDRAFT_722098 [Laetiporus sulphureus 93-53]